MSIVKLGKNQIEAFTGFLDELSEGDLTFVKEPVTDPATIRSWASPEAAGARWLAMDGGSVTGFLEVLPLTGWSDHVGEIRLVVHPGHRGQGLGRDLARRALLHAASTGLTKLIVEIVAEQEAHLSIFTSIGFTGEALLRDHIRDREGKLRDVIMLAHFLEDTNEDLATLGLLDELE
jgi:RimJ/RimL family protein N-acetyltransferase